MWGDKETTAPIPSVAPDGEQPFALTRNDSIPFTEEKNKSSGGMTVIPMPKLMEIRFPVKPAVIEGLLPVGTYLLAGAPKVGKSFFVLQMAYRVSTGGTFLDCPVHPGTVLYLALEDTLDRLQKRLVQMTEQDSPDLILSVLADTLDENLLAQLEGFLMDYAKLSFTTPAPPLFSIPQRWPEHLGFDHPQPFSFAREKQCDYLPQLYRVQERYWYQEQGFRFLLYHA